MSRIWFSIWRTNNKKKKDGKQKRRRIITKHEAIVASSSVDLSKMRDLLRAYFSRRTLVSLYNFFFSLSRKLLTSFPLSLLIPKSNDGDGDGAVAEPEAVPFLDLSKPSSPISFPIKALQDLKSRSYFDSFHFQFNRSTVPLRRNSDVSPNLPRVLVCHDMKGGYVEDKWVQGCENEAGFAIWHWYLMDVFVYFSHSLVTLPPPCWTNTAHRHGVKVCVVSKNVWFLQHPNLLLHVNAKIRFQFTEIH